MAKLSMLLTRPFHRAICEIIDAPRAALLPVIAVVTFCTITASAASSHQATFATPEEAVQALVTAVKARDTKTVLAVLGEDARPLISSGDTVADQQSRERFLDSYDEAHSVVKDGDAKAVLQTGKDDWPFPIPLVKEQAGWRFDSVAGKEEILDRRIGANELSTIQACLAYVDAQREYYARDPDSDKLLHYSEKFSSAPGKRDGLYWETTADEQPSPLGALFARARSEGYGKQERRVKPAPYHGYYYRILTAQGPNAAGGAYSYLAHGKMLGGFALVAYPAQWGNSGVMTFMVNQDAVVFQKDLGPDTAAVAAAIKTFNPDDSWKRVEGEK